MIQKSTIIMLWTAFEEAQVDLKSDSPPLVQMKDSRCNTEAKRGQGPDEKNGLATDNCSPFILPDWFFLCVLLKVDEQRILIGLQAPITQK